MVLAGGGTGGHVYPSLAVARALEAEMRGRAEALDMLYIGVKGRVDAQIVPREGIAFRAISAGQLRVASPITFARNIVKLALGIVQSLWALGRYRPDVVFATGGYASVPVSVAARVLRKPLVVYLPDVTPGWAVRLLSRLATRMTTTSERALDYLPAHKTTVVGYPVRGDFWSLDRNAARDRGGLPRDAKVVLVTGASLGAHAINRAIVAALPDLLARAHVMHLTGADDEAWAIAQREQLDANLRERYHVRGYTDDMPAAMIAADLVVSRSGASTLGELPAAGAAAILVPGEYEGWSQAPNAEYLQAQGGAVMLRNAEIERLGEVVIELLEDDARRERMAAAMRTLARPDAARDLARTLIEVAA
ncbi:MAG: UDP-N-acetylglucosamine--N-acetylmuramyl-(pentapeptide) pyrophosphoryl-undecaprenol N-acetylglucosamine transferase [Dehalococcoidia bacterium]